MALPGLELMFNSVKTQIKAPQDSVICVLHWQIVSSGFKCIGVGEKSGRNEEETEMLPDGWNTSPDLYVLRYKSDATGAVYVFKVIAVDGTLLVHFWKDGEDSKVATMNVCTEDYATQDFSSYKNALRHVSELCKHFKKEILDELKPSSPKAGTSRRGNNSRQRDDHDPLRVPGTGSRRPRPTPEWNDPDDPFSVGRGDLDPLHGGIGGGMLFDPMRGGRGPRFGMDPSAGLPSRLPPGAVPPGARFDPFGPPGTHPGQRPGPDPDHMKPPDYDDMFM
ncbi:proteasome inhibitor PI31 subunit-like [Mercenaria mercenaria]|uniref:proteasome inhibitor PI31 subunit-like n=1 Tax=Mercenaria mercenaria TaxID=6596 RepID=UPI00234E66B5|nr:proteasome inhibitor PI31 subunit-like [Mercenaria mercenaria]